MRIQRLVRLGVIFVVVLDAMGGRVFCQIKKECDKPEEKRNSGIPAQRTAGKLTRLEKAAGFGMTDLAGAKSATNLI